MQKQLVRVTLLCYAKSSLRWVPTTPSEITINIRSTLHHCLIFAVRSCAKSRPLPLAVSRLSRGTTLLSALHYCRDSVRLLCSTSVSHSLFPFPLVFAAVAALIAAAAAAANRGGVFWTVFALEDYSSEQQTSFSCAPRASHRLSASANY